MKRWPRVSSPAAMPPTEKRTISGSSVSGPKVATMECSGRTQPSDPGSLDFSPQRLDFCLFGRREPGGFEKALDGAFGRADGWAFFLLLHVGLPDRHPLHRERE